MLLEFLKIAGLILSQKKAILQLEACKIAVYIM